MFWAENDALLFWVTLFLTKTKQLFFQRQITRTNFHMSLIFTLKHPKFLLLFDSLKKIDLETPYNYILFKK